MTTKTQQTIDTVYSADTVEWCPVSGLENVLVCGTYQLLQDSPSETEQERSTSHLNSAESSGYQEASLDHTGTPTETVDKASSKNRAGRCLLYTLDDSQTSLGEVDRCETKAILDIKWRREVMKYSTAPAALFATVDSVGGTVVYKVSKDEENSSTMNFSNGYSLEKCASHTNTHYDEACGTELLNLACEWTYGAENGGDSKLLVSATDGTISLYAIRDDSDELHCERKWLAHSSKYLPAAEAWTVTSDVFNGSVVYSGGEDAKLKAWDLRDGCLRPLWTANAHDQGVCSMQSHPTIEHILATGSYDEKVMIWDTRAPKQPLSELDMGGGVWRIKWHPDDPNTMLTACIYNNFHIVQMSQDMGGLDIVQSYEDHDSLAYGADWHRLSNRSAVSTIATCSFYDHKLDLWSWDTR